MSQNNHHSLYDQRQNFFLAPSPTARGAVVFCLLVGAITFVAGMVTGEQTRTWGSFLLSLWFFFALALGGMAFAAMQDVIGAKWGRPIIRINESFGSFLPIAAFCFIVFLLAIKFDLARANEVYKWIKDPSILDHFWGKKTWLQENAMVGRNIFAILAIVALAGWQFRHKLGRDRAMVAGNREEAARLGAAAKHSLRHWSAPLLVCYAILFSLLAFDLLMSLAPTWFSTLWAGWAFAVMMQTLMATMLLFMFALKDTNIGHLIGRQQFHDIGKMMHGFTVFFAYLTYAHILTYWYGNVPEETEYFIHRLHAPWVYLVIAAPIMSFLIPLFALIPKPSKWTAGITIPLAVLILFAQWMTLIIVVQPEVVDAAAWRMPWLEAGTFLGFLGLFLLSIFRFGKKNPMVAVGDPLLVDALAEAHH